MAIADYPVSRPTAAEIAIIKREMLRFGFVINSGRIPSKIQERTLRETLSGSHSG